jgi:outer membrane protein, adhesin transport system
LNLKKLLVRIVNLSLRPLLSLFASGWVQAQSLPEAVAIALSQYPTIFAAQASQQAAEYEVTRAQGAYWPQVSWTGTYTYYNTGMVPSTWIQSPSVSLNLWSGGRIQADVDRARAQVEASKHSVSITRDQVAQLAVQAYINWARSQELERSARENYSAHQRLHALVSKMVGVDPGRSVDLEQVSARLAGAQLTLEQNKAGLAVAVERIRRMLSGVVPQEPSGLDIMPAQMPTSLEVALTYLGDTNPIIARQLTTLAVARANLASAKSQHSPQLNATYGKQTFQGTAQGDYVAQVTLTVPIFQGGSTYGATQSAIAQLEAAEHGLKETRITLQENLRTSWINWLSAQERFKVADQQVAHGAKALAGYWQQYQVSRRQMNELLSVQNELFTFQVNKISARFDVLNFRIAVLASIGRLASGYSLSMHKAEPSASRQQPLTRTSP